MNIGVMVDQWVAALLPHTASRSPVWVLDEPWNKWM